MRVLVLGSGGREHALTWKISQSSSLTELFVMPGNGGTAQIAENIPGNPEDPDEVLSAAKKVKADLVVVGPEAPLVKGVSDYLAQEKIPVFGPSRDAAKIEGSKAFAKELMQKYGVPTGRAAIFEDSESALNHLKNLTPPIVVKADGLAAGKGVIIAKTHEEAASAIETIMVQRKFGDAGNRILIEEFLEGEEVSYFVITDGKEILPLTSAQDYKRAYDNDEGPNTGGMGSYSPFPKMTRIEEEEIIAGIFEPVIYALRKGGMPYKGTLYGGLIKTKEGYKVLEFNARFGDPETQVVLPRLEGDFLGLLAAAAEGNLNNAPRLKVSNMKALTVVLASGGYPESYETGFEISGLEEINDPSVTIFHAGTRIENGKIVTAGGRVLNVTATAESFKEAREKAYAAVSQIRFKNMHYRKDIGERVMKDEDN
jgi:phosphoribosylamine--glycine ligase